MIVPPPPPRVSEMRAGTRLVAGLGYSTVLPECDFETYSEAGLRWDEETQKWKQPHGAAGTAKGLNLVGAAVYAQHPSTEVLCLAWNLKDGTGPHQWRPGMPPPFHLLDHVQRGGLLEAWNVAFEYWIWMEVCVPRYGWPPLVPRNLRCAMAKARAFGLPGKLAEAGKVLGVATQKDADGKRLLDKFSVPRNPTKPDPRRRIRPEEDPVDGPKLWAYNLTDIEAEAEISALCPDLEGDELELWFLDQAINRRGVQVDLEGVENCIALVDTTLERNDAELCKLTSGTVSRASEVQKLSGWLGGIGVVMPSMDEDAVTVAVDDLVKRIAEMGGASPHAGNQAHIQPLRAALRALEIRQATGSASVKKVYSMRHQAARGGRLHDLFQYHGAKTGRFVATNPQPSNLPKAGPDVVRCGYDGPRAFAAGCGKYHGASLTKCPWCGVEGPPGRKAEWCADAAVNALEIISLRSVEAVEAFFGNVLLTISGCLRGLFTSAPDKMLVSSDFTAIEAVVIAALAGEEWRMEVFRNKTDVYLESISRSTGTSVDEMKAYKKQTGMHHPLRAKGKIQELACLGPRTEVLTRRGYVPLVHVKQSDEVWDGIEWVKHQGLVSKGLQKTIDLDGIEMTQKHRVHLNGSWREAKQLASNESMLSRALDNSSATLPASASTERPEAGPKSGCCAIAAPRPTTSPTTTCCGAPQPGATLAPNAPQPPSGRCSTSTPPSCRTTNTDAAFSIDWPRAATGVTTPTTPGTRTTAAEASTCGRLGWKTKPRFSSTSSRFRDGMTRLWTLIEKTWTVATSRATFGSLRAKKTATTSEPSEICSAVSKSLKPVFDLAHAGPRNRFTVRSARGHLLVHNCGYGGWLGALKAFGAQGTDEELKQQLLAWRAASPAIVELWGGQTRTFGRSTEYFGLEGAAVVAVMTPGVRQTVMRLNGTPTGASFLYQGTVLYMTLPSGRHIAYQNAKITQTNTWRGYRLTFEGWNTNQKKGPPGWLTMDLYSGLLAENLTQAVARDILRHSIIALERDDYPVVIHVYDEIVCESNKSVEGLEAHMGAMPAWAEGWPVSATGGYSLKRYCKA